MGCYKCHRSYINLNVGEQDDDLYATSHLAKQIWLHLITKNIHCQHVFGRKMWEKEKHVSPSIVSQNRFILKVSFKKQPETSEGFNGFLPENIIFYLSMTFPWLLFHLPPCTEDIWFACFTIMLVVLKVILLWLNCLETSEQRRCGTGNEGCTSREQYALKITVVPSVKWKSLETPVVHLHPSIPLPLVVTLPQR